MKTAVRNEGGQAVIIVALSIAVLLGALALGLDWGYGFTQRRVAQNAADAAALATARALATSTALVDHRVVYDISQEALYCVAQSYAEQNQSSFVPSDAVTELLVQIGDETPTWSNVIDGGCPWSGTGTPVPPNTVYVRVLAGTTYPSLVASIAGRPEITARASARARITAAQDDYPVWPMVRHYDPADFESTCAAPCTDPQPFTFWSAKGSAENKNMVFGSFKGLVDYSRSSPRLLSLAKPKTVDQLIESWDERWSLRAQPPKSPKTPDASRKCPSGGWDTAGDEDPNSQDKQCSIPNWTFYTFGGTLSLDTDWRKDAKGLQEKPSDIGPRDRTVCNESTMPDGLAAPSCGDGNSGKGDWVETAPNGNLGENMSEQMLAYIDAHPLTTALSDQPVPGSGGRVLYGRAAVIEVYLWDCAESFKDSKSGEQWALEMPAAGDCSQIADTPAVKVDRVHLFTAAPFTFYEGLVSTQMIQGFWGGAFGDPKWCEANPEKCGVPNAFSNTAFLVPDD